MKNNNLLLWYLLLISLAFTSISCQKAKEQKTETPIKVTKKLSLGFTPMAGEPTSNSIILQARANEEKDSIELNGVSCYMRFEYGTSRDLDVTYFTPWKKTEQSSGYISKVKVGGLRPNTFYYYRVHFGEDTLDTQTSLVCSFSTLPGEFQRDDFRFALSSCMHYERFMAVFKEDAGEFYKEKRPLYTEEDQRLGMPGYFTLLQQRPRFWIANGDNIYYDHIYQNDTVFLKTTEEMRKVWLRQFNMPRLADLFRETPVFWLKDDHDFRYDDGDTSNFNKGKQRPFPSFADGVKIFREQVPIVFPENSKSPTYRTYRVNSDIQIWFLEGRDFRSPNALKDDTLKSMWGIEQKNWLKKTLLESNASYKLIISPTPLIGPDDIRKTDNHTNPGGFKAEGEWFMSWLKSNGFLNKGLYFFCGDRHWQYHSIHPTGFQEFASGAFTTANSREGRKPGDPASTDPNAKIKQPYIQENPIGAFILFDYKKERENPLKLQFISEFGEVIYRTELIPAQP